MRYGSRTVLYLVPQVNVVFLTITWGEDGQGHESNESRGVSVFKSSRARATWEKKKRYFVTGYFVHTLASTLYSNQQVIPFRCDRVMICAQTCGPAVPFLWHQRALFCGREPDVFS